MQRSSQPATLFTAAGRIPPDNIPKVAREASLFHHSAVVTFPGNSAHSSLFSAESNVGAKRILGHFFHKPLWRLERQRHFLGCKFHFCQHQRCKRRRKDVQFKDMYPTGNEKHVFLITRPSAFPRKCGSLSAVMGSSASSPISRPALL